MARGRKRDGAAVLGASGRNETGTGTRTLSLAILRIDFSLPDCEWERSVGDIYEDKHPLYGRSRDARGRDGSERRRDVESDGSKMVVGVPSS